MNRRNLLKSAVGSVLGLFGYKAVSKAEAPQKRQEDIVNLIASQMVGCRVSVFQNDKKVNNNHPLYKFLLNPNKNDTFDELMYQWSSQLDLTGTSLIWMISNTLGIPVELRSIPTALAIPQPSTTDNYPNGFYRIQPIYPYGTWENISVHPITIIPAEWMLKFVSSFDNGGLCPLLAPRSFTTYDSIEFYHKQIRLLVVQPRCNYIAAKLTRHLAPFFGENLRIEIIAPKLDSEAQKEIELLVNCRAITKNELREMYGLGKVNSCGEDIVCSTKAVF